MAISNAVVRLLRKHSGRGPTKAKTIVSGDYIAVVLGDYLTTSAQTIIRQGNAEAVVFGRAALHKAITAEMVEAVERLSGRSVLAHMSSDHFAPDISIESFILAPA